MHRSWKKVQFFDFCDFRKFLKKRVKHDFWPRMLINHNQHSTINIFPKFQVSPTNMKKVMVEKPKVDTFLSGTVFVLVAYVLLVFMYILVYMKQY